MPESSVSQPPVIAASLLQLFVSAEQAESLPADLLEEFTSRTAIEGLPAARGWYRRQAVRTAGHLLAEQFRSAPLLLLIAVIVSFVLLYCSVRTVDAGVASFLAHVQIYRYIPAKVFFLVYVGIIERILCPLLAGWIGAAIARGRRMAVAMLLGTIGILPVFMWIRMIIWRRPAFMRHFAISSIIQPLLLLTPTFLFLGAILYRRSQMRNRKRLTA
jgi:hypothetical protein